MDSFHHAVCLKQRIIQSYRAGERWKPGQHDIQCSLSDLNNEALSVCVSGEVVVWDQRQKVVEGAP